MGKFVSVLLLVVATAPGSYADPGPVKVLSTKREIFYFKVAKELIGARVEVFDLKGNKLAVDSIARKRVIIDFYYDQPGTYTIKITKGEVLESFNYIKQQPSHAERFDGDYIVVVQ